MPRKRRCFDLSARWLFACCLLLSTYGCASETAPPATGDSPASSSAEAAADVKRVAADSLPPLGDPLPVLDDGRVEIAPPADWNIGGRRQGYLVRFFSSGENDLPRILATVEPTPLTEINTATAENVEQFADLLAQLLQSEGAELLEPVRPLVIGDNPWARYVRSGALNNVVVERQVLVTVADGRLYTIELQVYSGTILQHRDHAYAVAAGMKFLKTPPDAAADPFDDANAPPADDGQTLELSPTSRRQDDDALNFCGAAQSCELRPKHKGGKA